MTEPTGRDLAIAILRGCPELGVHNRDFAHHCFRHADEMPIFYSTPEGLAASPLVLCPTCHWVGLVWPDAWEVPDDLRGRIRLE